MLSATKKFFFLNLILNFFLDFVDGICSNDHNLSYLKWQCHAVGSWQDEEVGKCSELRSIAPVESSFERIRTFLTLLMLGVMAESWGSFQEPIFPIPLDFASSRFL